LTAPDHSANPLLHRPLVFVTGKGGVGKTTVAAALGLAAAAEGRRTIVCEVGAQKRLPAMFRRPPGDDGEELRLGEALWTVSIDPNRALREWLARQLGSRYLVELLTRSNAFQYFVAAAPGARELVTVTKLWELAQADRWRKGARAYDVVVVDLPSSGHGVGLLRTARTFRDVTRVGPVASQAGAVAQAIEDPTRSAVVAVALPGELPVSETLERRPSAPAGSSASSPACAGVRRRRWSRCRSSSPPRSRCRTWRPSARSSRASSRRRAGTAGAGGRRRRSRLRPARRGLPRRG
jgi:Mrp family chromosome partitioning ATPase